MHELCKQFSVVLNKFVMNMHQDSVLNALFFIITYCKGLFYEGVSESMDEYENNEWLHRGNLTQTNELPG
jgi:hypothetical protein